METKSCNKVAKTFYCHVCDYNTERKSSFDKHLLTSKHFKETNGNKKLQKSCDDNNQTITNYSCEHCGKILKTRSGLWKHRKICDNELGLTDKEIINLLIKQTEKLTNIIENIDKFYIYL